MPPVNDTDVYAHDIGLIAIKDEGSGGLAGFNVLIGGGMGMTHGNKKTYARLGQLVGFCLPKEVGEVAEAIMLVQRDNGDRTNRKHARYIFRSLVADIRVDLSTLLMTWVWTSSNGKLRSGSADNFHLLANMSHSLRILMISAGG